MRLFRLAWLLIAVGILGLAQDLKDLEKRVTDFTLVNGLRFVLLERHEIPAISFHTLVAAGSVNDPPGQAGLAKLLERMAIKGSETIGSRNWADEKKALDAMDDAFERMESERNKGPRMNEGQYETLRTQWRIAVDQAHRLSQARDYMRILEENGATSMRSTTGYSSIQFSYTLPSNRMELWFAMESQRLLHPVLREFYQERDTLVEEYNKAQLNPQTRLLDTFLATAFVAQPYRVSPLGLASDIGELRRSEARAFMDKYFVPGNITIAMVGDVNPAEARRLAETYFGPMPARPMPPVIRTLDPPQQGPRNVVLDLSMQPVAVIGYRRPSYLDKDDAVLDVLQAVLVTESDGIAYRDLVNEKKLAFGLQAGSTYPDGRYPNLFLFFLAPARTHTAEENLKALEDLLNRLKSQRVGTDALNQAKARIRSLSYERLQSSPTMAEMLSIYASSYGDWRKLFTLTEDVRTVSEDDILRVTQRYFHPANRTTVFLTAPPPMAPKTAGGAQ